MNTTTLAIERAMTQASRAAYAGERPLFNGTPCGQKALWAYRYSAANAAARKLVAERKATKIERTNDGN